MTSNLRQKDDAMMKSGTFGETPSATADAKKKARTVSARMENVVAPVGGKAKMAHVVKDLVERNSIM